MINIRDGLFEETASTVRQTKAMVAFNLMRKQAVKQGFFSEKEINGEIRASQSNVKQTNDGKTKNPPLPI